MVRNVKEHGNGSNGRPAVLPAGGNGHVGLVESPDLPAIDGGRPVRQATAGWGYLRLRREDYGEPELAGWASWIAQQAWSDAWVFFKHEDAGAGPRLALRLIEAYSGAGEEPVLDPR